MYFLIVLVFISYFTDTFQFFEVGSYGVTAIDFAALALYIVFIKRVFWNGDELKFRKQTAHIFLLLLLFAACLSGLTPLIKGSTPQMIQYFKTTIHFVFFLLFTFICAFYKIETKVWTRVIKIWLILSIVINLFGIYQIIARANDLPLAWLEFTNVSLTGRATDDMSNVRQLSLRYGNFYRATSIFTEPSALASFNLVIQIFLIIPFVQKLKPFFKSNILNICIFLISLLTLFLCFSMTGFVGLALIIGGVFIFNLSKRLLPFIAAMLVSLILLIAADGLIKSYSGISVVQLFSKRISGLLFKTQGTEGESVGVRLRSAEVGIAIWEEHFLIGSGLGLIAFNNRKGVEFGDFSTVAVLAEMGLVGFIAFVGLFISLFIVTGRFVVNNKRLKQLPEDLQRLSGMLLYIMIYLFLINFISGNNLISYVLWLFIGMIFSIINNYYHALNIKLYSFKLMKIPLNKNLQEKVSKYLEKKEE